jgi:predicted neuraminidase
MRIFITFLFLVFWNVIPVCSQQQRKNTSVSSQSDFLLTENVFPLQDQHCHGSSIVELPDKDLLVAWFQGSGERTADDVAIKGARYNHDTQTWGEPFILADVPDFPDINPVVFIDSRSRLWLIWYTVMAYQWESSILKYRISENYMQDSGPPEWKWQDMIHIKPDGSTPEGIGKNDPFVLTLKSKLDDYYQSLMATVKLKPEENSMINDTSVEKAKNHYLDIAKGMNLISNGSDIGEKGEKVKTRLGYPLMRRIGWQSRNKPLILGNRMLLPLYSDGFDFSLVAITDNWGNTWQFSEPIVGAGAVQPTLALCHDSSIVALMRDNGPPPQRLMKSISNDLGKTWSTVTDSDIPNPGTAADLVVLKSGNWVLVHNDIEEGRYRLSVWLSQDEGKTWPFRKILVNGVPGSLVRGHYPAFIEGYDGKIHISFTNQVPGADGKTALKCISHACFSEKWLLKL